jgi:hypothetical protein
MFSSEYYNMTRLKIMILIVFWLFFLTGLAGAADFQSHPPIRPLAQPSQRPWGLGQKVFVAPTGDDANPGTEAKPWRTINAALKHLEPGDTLYLRGGIYFENVYCAIAGRPDAFITIRSYPGELAVIDGGLSEFQQDARGCWQPYKDGAAGEFISTRFYKNIRDVVGLFGDSNVGLQTYWYAMDLRSDNELWIPDEKLMVKPIYCGPGLWYDKQTGRIHCRLAHTRLELPASSNHKITHYRGQTDPRQLPLVIAPFNSRPLFVDQAMYIRFQDLVIRGGGYVTVDLLFGVGIEFDNCTIYAGTYGIWAKNTGPLKMTHCGVYGMIPPWAFRRENELYSYTSKAYPPFLEDNQGGQSYHSKSVQPQKIVRNIARLPTHAVLATAGGYEFEVFYYPANHDWEISHCEFTDGHDGVYLSGKDIYFHHNWVDNLQDDAVYISSPTTYFPTRLFIYQNLISTCTTAFGAHGRGGPGGDIYMYRNIVDMRRPVQYHRPVPNQPETKLIIRGSTIFQIHGSRHLLHMERMYFYQNTFLYPANHIRGAFTGGTALAWHESAARRVFNNIFVFYGLGGKYPKPGFGKNRDKADLQIDGNLHWNLTAGEGASPDWLKSLRDHKISQSNKINYPDGLAARCFAADPRFIRVSDDPKVVNDYRLQKDSPAIGKGVPLPREWPDILKLQEKNPDIGALPSYGAQLMVGRHSRITAGMPGEPQ